MAKKKISERSKKTPVDFEVPMKLKEGVMGGGNIDSGEDYGWRSLTAQAQRDLSPLAQKRMQEIAFYLYDSNPMAHRIIDIGKEFIVGDGFRYMAKDEKIQKVLDEFWNDPDNAWNIKQDSKVLELSLWGEQCYPVYVNKHNGHVKIGYLDPGLISKVKLDSSNPERVDEVHWSKRSKVIKWKAINTDNKVRSKTSGRLVGDCFYFSINRVVFSSRGRSDLLPLCLHPDTLLNTLEGDIPIKKLAGKEVLLYSWDQNKNKLVVGNATDIRKTRSNAELVKVHFTNGDSIITTPDHPLLLINAKAYRQAKDFLPSDRVQAVCRKVKDGYMWVQYKKSKWKLEHRFIMEQILGRELSHTELVHHKNGDTLDNRVENLSVMSRANHALLHIEDNLHQTKSMLKHKKVMAEKMKGNSHAKGNRFKLTKEQIQKEVVALKNRYKNMSTKQKKELKERMTKTSLARFQDGKKINQYATFNHEVLFVEKLDYKSDVYDLNVENYNNFSANGIIVHNCDWIDGYDQFLFARLERAFFLNNYIWDILCEGMSKEEVEEFAKNLKTPSPGSARVHNEKIKYSTVSSNLESADASSEANLFKTQILGGAGYPDFWFGESDKTTRACYSDDTETLTENGWKKYWEIEKDEKIATFNRNKDCIEFHIPKAFYLYDYKGEMYHFENKRTDIMVTPEHKIWLKEGHSNKWELIKAEDITYKTFFIREGAKNWTGKNTKYLDLPYVAYDVQSRKKDFPRKIKMDIWMEFLGWYLSEGWLGKSKNQFSVSIAQKDKKNILKIRKMLTALGFPFRERYNDKGCLIFSLNNKSLWYYLDKNVGNGSASKKIPQYVLQLNKNLLKILFASMMDGDGHYDNRKGRNCFTYATKSPMLKNDFQTLCLLIGFSTRTRIGKKDKFRWFEITGSKTIERDIRNRGQVVRGKQYDSHIQKEKYNGKVYCFEVPNALFITRRNDKIAIQSNTAQEVSLPTLKKLRGRQKYIKYMIEYIFNFVIDQKIIHGMLPKDVDRKFVVMPAPIITKDARGLAITVDKFANAMTVAVDRGWIGEDTARTAFRTFMTDLGIELHELEELSNYAQTYKKAKGGKDDSETKDKDKGKKDEGKQDE